MLFPKGEAAAEIHKFRFRSNLRFRQPTLSDGFGNPKISLFINVYHHVSDVNYGYIQHVRRLQQLPAATFRSGCLQKLPVAREQRIGNGKAFFTSTMVPWPKIWPLLMVGVSWVTISTMKYPRYAYCCGFETNVEIDLDIYNDIQYTWMRKSSKKEQL